MYLAEIELLKEDLRQSRKAITYRGGTIGATAGFKEVAEQIIKLPNNATVGTVIDSNTAYKKTVPSGSTKYAFLNSLGGMTYKVTIKNENVLDGGTLDATNKYFDINEEYKERIKYLIVDKPLPEGIQVVAFNENDVGRVINSGETYVDLSGLDVSYIQLLGEATINFILTEDLIPYEPAYYDELRDSKVTAIESHGAQLIPFPFLSGNKTENGVTFTCNDGSITVNGTATADVTFILAVIALKGTYALSGTVGGSAKTYYMAMGSSDYADVGNGITRTYSEEMRQNIFIRIVKDTTLNNVVFKPMLNKGSTAVPYKPYRAEPITYAIPDAIQVGKGVNGYANTISFENALKIQKVYRKVFDGTENWSVGGNTSGLMRLDYGDSIMPTALDRQPCLANNLIGSTNAPNSLNEGEFCILSTSIYIRKESISNPNGDANTAEKIANFKAWLAENPLEVVYALAEPITEDISASLGAFKGLIEVEGGGILKFANTHENAVPSTITFQTITGG